MINQKLYAEICAKPEAMAFGFSFMELPSMPIEYGDCVRVSLVDGNLVWEVIKPEQMYVEPPKGFLPMDFGLPTKEEA